MSTIPRPMKPCAGRGCAAPAVLRGAYCAACQQERDRAHNEDHAVYRSAAYLAGRTAVMAAYPFCHAERGASSSCSGPLHAHHVNGDRADQRWRENFAPVCERHHMQLEREPSNGPLHAAVADTMGRRR